MFFNFLLVAIGSFLAINYYAQSGNVWIYICAFAAVLICFSIFSALLENKKWADYAEVIRLVLLAGVGLALVFNHQLFNAGIISVAVSVVLLFCTWVMARRYEKKMWSKCCW